MPFLPDKWIPFADYQFKPTKPTVPAPNPDPDFALTPIFFSESPRFLNS
jgi:hypothetical protein